MKRFILAGLGVVTLSAATIVGYSAASQASPGGSNQPVQANQPALAPGDSTIIAPSAGEDTFVPLTPCRIVDTHSGGGAVASGATRTVHAAGTTGFPAQGGKSGGCGVPAAATAVNVSITTTKARRAGYLTAYPAGTTRPHSRTISYVKSSALTASSTVKLGGGQLRFYNHGSTVQVIIDVIGYVIPPIHAIVNPGGGLYAATSRVLSATNTSTGNYSVVTDRDLTGCSVSAGVSGGEYYISAFVSGDDVDATMWSLSGASVVTPTNLFWIFTVTC